MIPVHIAILLLTIHYLGDFVLQSDYMAINKSKSMKALLTHTGIYSLCFLLVAFLILSPIQAIAFFVATFWIHTAQDYITSRISAKLYREERRHDFFLCIGFDQLLHFVQLFMTYQILTNQ